MPNISQHKDLNVATVFAALGDNTRLEIISKLQQGNEYSLSELTQGFSLTRQGVTRHLRVLENAGLVSRQRAGRETRYHLETEALNRAKNYLDHASSQWDDSIYRLKKHLEE